MHMELIWRVGKTSVDFQVNKQTITLQSTLGMHKALIYIVRSQSYGLCKNLILHLVLNGQPVNCEGIFTKYDRYVLH